MWIKIDKKYALTPGQAESVTWSPIQRLAFAVIAEAIQQWRLVHARDDAKSQAQGQELQAWFNDSESDHTFSFVGCCDICHIDPRWVLRRIGEQHGNTYQIAAAKRWRSHGTYAPRRVVTTARRLPSRPIAAPGRRNLVADPSGYTGCTFSDTGDGPEGGAPDMAG